MEKKFRAYMRSRGLKLAGLKLPHALDAMSDFWCTEIETKVHDVDGDALVVYEDVTNHGKGTRLELGMVRLLRFPPESEDVGVGRALRLRLRLCYKWDMDVIRDVLPHGTWSLACWARADVVAFKQAISEMAGVKAMYDKAPSEVNVTFEDAICPLTNVRPSPGSRQMWWGVSDVT